MCGVAPAAADEGVHELADALLALSGEVRVSSSGDLISNISHVDDGRFHCPFPGCKRSFAELWRLKVHYRAPPNVRGSGKERGHGLRLDRCPKCDEVLKVGGHHVRCSARDIAGQLPKKMRRTPEARVQHACAGGGSTQLFEELPAGACTNQQRRTRHVADQQQQLEACGEGVDGWPQLQTGAGRQAAPDMPAGGQQPGSVHLLRLQQLLARVDEHLGYETTDSTDNSRDDKHQLTSDTAHGSAACSYAGQWEQDVLEPKQGRMAELMVDNSWSELDYSQPHQASCWSQQTVQQQPLQHMFPQQQLSGQHEAQEQHGQLHVTQCHVETCSQLQSEPLNAGQPSSGCSMLTAVQHPLDPLGSVLQHALCVAAAAHALPSPAGRPADAAASSDEVGLLALLKHLLHQGT